MTIERYGTIRLTDVQKRIIKFTERYVQVHFEVPTLDRVEHEFQSTKGMAYKNGYNLLMNAGVLQLIASNAIEERRRREYEKTARCTINSIRSGVREMSAEELRIKAFSVGDMHFNSCGVQWDFTFTVDRNRGQDDLLKTSEPFISEYSRYGNSLLEGVFKKWHTEA